MRACLLLSPHMLVRDYALGAGMAMWWQREPTRWLLLLSAKYRPPGALCQHCQKACARMNRISCPLPATAGQCVQGQVGARPRVGVPHMHGRAGGCMQQRDRGDE